MSSLEDIEKIEEVLALLDSYIRPAEPRAATRTSDTRPAEARAATRASAPDELGNYDYNYDYDKGDKSIEKAGVRGGTTTSYTRLAEPRAATRTSYFRPALDGLRSYEFGYQGGNSIEFVYFSDRFFEVIF